MAAGVGTCLEYRTRLITTVFLVSNQVPYICEKMEGSDEPDSTSDTYMGVATISDSLGHISLMEFIGQFIAHLYIAFCLAHFKGLCSKTQNGP
jgi:hypothetical protein